MTSLNPNPVRELYMTVIENVINNVQELHKSPEGHVLKTLWLDKLMQSKAVDFPTEAPGWETEQPRALNKDLMPPNGGLKTEIQVPQWNQRMIQPVAAAPVQKGLLLIPPQQTAQLWSYMTPPQLINNRGQFVQVMRRPNGGFHAQPILLPGPMQPAGLQAPVVQQQIPSLLQGGLPQQPGVMTQPYVFATAMTPRLASTASSWTQQVQQASGQTGATWACGAAATPQVSGWTTAVSEVPRSTPWFQVQQAHIAPAPQTRATGLSSAWEPQAQQLSSLLLQVDGTGDDTSSSDSSDEEEDVNEKEDKSEQSEDEPLNSGDDETDNDGREDEIDTDNVVICLYEKVARIKNRWKFQLRDGIMNLNGEDYIFSKAFGEAEW